MDTNIIRARIHDAVETYGRDLPVDAGLAARIRGSEKRPPREIPGRGLARTLLAAMLLLFCGGAAFGVGASWGKVTFGEGAVFRFFQNHRFPSFRSIAVFNWLLEAAACGGLLILIFVLLRPLVRRVGGQRMVCFLWVLVAVRLLVPVALPNPLMNSLRPGFSTDAAARPLADQIRVRLADACADARWAYEQKLGTPGSPAVARVMPGRADGTQVFWNAVGEFGLATAYGWTGTWLLMGWALAAGLIMTFFVLYDLRKRRREGGQIGYLAVWTAVRHLCAALQWFNPLVWLASHLARADLERALEEDRPRAAKGKRMACAVLAGLMLVASFGTAEYRQSDPEVRGALNEPDADDPMEAWDRAWSCAAAYTPAIISGPETAAARAASLGKTRLFRDGSAGEVAARKAEGGWIVDCGEAVYEFDECGALLSFSHAPSGREMKPLRAQLPEEIQLYAQKYARKFIRMAGQTAEPEGMTVEQAQTDGIATYIPVRAANGEEEWRLVLWMKDTEMQIDSFGRVR